MDKRISRLNARVPCLKPFKDAAEKYCERKGRKMSFDDKVLEIPESLPMLPVRDIVVFPYMILPLYVGRESSIRAVEEALSKNRLIFLASQKEITEENPTENTIYRTGTIAMIMRMRKLSDGRVKILIQGVAKGRIKKFNKSEPSFDVSV